MKLRILSGKTGLKENIRDDQLKTFHSSANLIIQGSGDVRVISLNDGRKAFLAGHIEGIGTSQGEIAPCQYNDSNFESLIRNKGIEQCQSEIEGRFILAIVGPEDSCEIFADKFGRKDLYYQRDEDRIALATDLTLLPNSSSPNDYDQVALIHSLTIYGYRPPKRHTIYKNIKRLGVKEVIRINGGQAEFSEIPFQPIPTGSYGEQELNQFADTLLEAVRLRGSNQGNIVYCSSGWDSTSLVACLVHIFGANKVRAVTNRVFISHRSGVMNEFEVKRVKALTDYFGVKLDIIDVDIRDQIPPEVAKYKSLSSLHNIFARTSMTHGHIADYVRKTMNGNESVFGGEISDGAFNLGFSQFITIFHTVIDFREYSDKMGSYLFGPTFLKQLQSGEFKDDCIYQLFRDRSHGAAFDELAKGGPEEQTQQLLSSFFLRGNRLPLWSLRNNKMITEKGMSDYTQEMESTYLNTAAQKATPETLYSWYLHLYNSFHWQGSTVSTWPLTAEANGFHLSLPFWDSRIQKFLSAMPEDWGRGLDLNPTKYPLKWMLKERIDYPLHLQTGPHSYQYDVNPNVTPNGEIVYASALTPHFKKLLGSKSYHDLLSPEFFDLNYVDHLVDNFVKGEEASGPAFGDLVALCQHAMMGWGKRDNTLAAAEYCPA